MGCCVGKPKINVEKRLRNKVMHEDQYMYWESIAPITKYQMDCLREVYWIIRMEDLVEGGVWAKLKIITEAFERNNFPMAQELCNNAELFFPNGDLDYVIDYNGRIYSVPMYLVSYPINLIAGPEDEEEMQPQKESEEDLTPRESIEGRGA